MNSNLKKGVFIVLGLCLLCGCSPKTKVKDEYSSHQTKQNAGIDEIMSSSIPEQTKVPEITAAPKKTNEPKTTPKPSATPVPTQETEMTSEDIQQQLQKVFRQFMNTTSIVFFEDEEWVITFEHNHSISIVLTDEEAHEIVKAPFDGTIMDSKKYIERMNILDYSAEIYDKYYDALKSSLNQDMKFKLQFQVVNPWANESYGSNYGAFWSCIDEDHPIQLIMIVALDKKEVQKNSFDLEQLNEQLSDFAEKDFDGTPVEIEILSAAVDSLSHYSETMLRRVFESDSFNEKRYRLKKKVYHEKEGVVSRPDDGVYIGPKVFYESEMSEIREKYTAEKSKELGFELSYAPYNERFFLLYISSMPGVCEQISYEAAEEVLTQDSAEPWTPFYKNRFLVGAAVYDEWKNAVRQWLPENTQLQLRCWITNPHSQVLYTEDQEKFFDATQIIPLSIQVYVLIQNIEDNVDIEQFHLTFKDYIHAYFPDASISGTIRTVMSDEEIPEYLLRECMDNKQSEVYEKVVKTSLS